MKDDYIKKINTKKNKPMQINSENINKFNIF